MSIIYTVVARGKDVVLAEYNTASGNFPQITRNILRKVPNNISITYTQGNQYTFHVINEDDFSYLCMTEIKFERRLAFLFLQHIREAFLEKYAESERRDAIQYALNNSFSNTIRQKMHQFNTDPPDKLMKLKTDLNDAKNIMVENIDKLLEREERLDILVKKTANMNTMATNIKKKSTEVKRQAQWRSIRLKIIIVLIVLIVIYLVLSIICGGFALKGCM
eukprot:TRINITY_DN1266_c0_g1_i11.p1 TRINITY_DN1266_c0_g1~~TRINITY_DN1266_c0_g1_i11.p1  ORF type:complete len:220 (+),score=18.59 TRINITY_DN1266_c0_g1_i11:62-721(+)